MMRLGTLAMFGLFAALIGGCILRRAYSVEVELRPDEVELARRFADEFVVGMTCRSPDEPAAGRANKRVVRYCEPREPQNVLLEWVEEPAHFGGSVMELHQHGPVRPAVRALAKDLEARFALTFGVDRIIVKRSRWRE